MPAEKFPYSDTRWALSPSRDVHVTLIEHDPEGVSTTYLVSRIHVGPIPNGEYYAPQGHALVLKFSASPYLTINGQVFVEANGPDLIKWATLVDSVSLSPKFPDPGEWVATRLDHSAFEDSPSKNY